ncbi:MAG: enoyl-CoA hydratase/isomerase family protein [Bryobacteraceae bacterium]|nr:enoyl-CoA hydratase/isomerase family protein [Bryobacteraceae bacterium]MDW8380000.1 enoyl-CoA hydratase/isomerase family protein [Bryobacterales bacterium]
MVSGDGIVRVTLNRPDKRNALNRATIERLTAEFEAAASNSNARCILLVGEGNDFCSGADLAELQQIRDASLLDNLEDARRLGRLFLLMRRHPLPVVAAVQGRALAGGCGLATASDLVLARADALFGYPEVNLAFVPAMVMSLLRRSVSEKRAFELLTTGKMISATEAFEAGLVNAVYPVEGFWERVEEFVSSLASKSSSAIRLTKQLLYQIDVMPVEAAIECGAQVNAIARMTEDCRRGIDAFLKRPR